MSKKSFWGLDENVASAFCYVLGPISGIIGYILEKENKTVRFHALQSIVTLGLLWVVTFIVGIIPIINWFSWIFSIAWVVVIVFLAYNAFVGNKFKVPVIGDEVEKTVNK